MPLIYINAPKGTFTRAAQNALAEEITNDALHGEKLPTTPFVKSTTWIYVREYDEDMVYHGGKPGGTKVISLEINAFEGGLDASAKSTLMAQVTESIRKHAGITGDVVPVYIIFRDVPDINWGVFGGPITLSALQNPDPDAKPI